MDDRELTADLVALAGRRARSVAVALIDLAASPIARFAFIDSDLETHFELGSVTKPLTGMLLADAIDHGEVSLDSTIASLLPNDSEGEFGSISLRELCTHTSGLPRLPRDLPTFLRAERFLLLGTDPYQRTDASGLLRVAARQRLWGRGQFRYSNLGAAVLGQLLALGASVEYGSLMTQRIFTPLRMRSSGVAGTRPMAPPGWSSMGRRRPPWTMGGYAPSGGVVSTLGDMVRLTTALLDGSAPGRGSLEPIAGVATDNAKQARGMFWVIDSTAGSDRRMIWHNGQTGGYSSFLGLAPHSRRATIVLANVARARDQQRIALGLARHFAISDPSDAQG